MRLLSRIATVCFTTVNIALQIVDAIIIVSSFTIDLVFLGGVSGEEGQKAVAVLVVLLLWRIARVVDGKLTFTLSLLLLSLTLPLSRCTARHGDMVIVQVIWWALLVLKFASR